MTTASADEERFWSMVKKSEGCWEWQGRARNQSGYGGFSAQGKEHMAHKWLYELRNGNIPIGFRLHQQCENPKCVRPDHVVLTRKRFALSGPRSPDWKGDAARTGSKRDRARRAFELGACENCGSPACDRHHKDGDTGNNTRENIAILCRRCHMIVDGRLKNLMDYPKQLPQQPKLCCDCGKLAKPLRKGICASCDQYLRRNGIHRSVQSTA